MMTTEPHAILIGADGMLGRAMQHQLRSRGWSFSAPGVGELDLASARSVQAYACLAAPREPRAIINCAAWTDVDGAETQEELATRINGAAIVDLLAMARDCGATLVNFGTDYVFAGNATHPYRTDEPLAPLNAYGRSKAVGERALFANTTTPWLHIRTSWLYAPWGKNFVRTIRQLLMTKPSIQVVHDQRGRPTSAENLARFTLDLLANDAKGVFHATDAGECTWFEFAQEIGRLAQAPGKVDPCTSDKFPRPAKRPAYSVLDISATERLLGAMPRWESSLAHVMARLDP
jgi:dTDP-4-dehydrorhamnose reductase